MGTKEKENKTRLSIPDMIGNSIASLVKEHIGFCNLRRREWVVKGTEAGTPKLHQCISIKPVGLIKNVDSLRCRK